VSIVGSGTVELHLLAIPLGGNALITTDDNPLSAQTVDLNLATLAIPPETDVERIHEVTFATSGAHHIDVTYLPGLSPELIPISYGGGLRSVVLCGVDIAGVYATMYRIDPTNGCVIQVSNDAGLTWSTFLDVGACIPTPPDVSHFLVDNPGAVRANVITPVSGAFGLEIDNDANDAINIQSHFAGRDVVIQKYTESTTNAHIILTHEVSAVAPFLELSSASAGLRQAISNEQLWLAPRLSAPTPDGRTQGGIYIDAADNRPYIILPGLFSTFYAQRLGAGTLTSLSASYTPLAATATPRIAISGTPPTLNMDLGLPPYQPPTTFVGDYAALPATSDPTIDFNVAVAAGLQTVTGKLRLPPYQPPTTLVGDFGALPPGSAPTIDFNVAVAAGLETVTGKLRLPPYAPLVPDNTLPLSGTKHFTGIEVDAFGSTLPFLIPAGYAISNVTTRGLWYFQRFLEAGSKFSNGVHTTDHDFPYYTDLVAQATSGAADADGFYAAEGAIFNLIADGFVASEDCYLKLEQSFQFTDGERKGEVYIDFDIAAPAPEFAWTHSVDVTGSDHAADVGQDGQYGIAPAWISGQGWQFYHAAHAYLTLHGIGDATTVVKRMTAHFTVAVTDGTDGASTLTGEARCDASFYNTLALTGFSGAFLYVEPFDNTNYVVKQPFVIGAGMNTDSANTHDWTMTIHSISISGNGTEPTWSKT
jgi:hypothetical protein